MDSMNRLLSIEIKNYKKFKEGKIFSISLDKTFFLGDNDSGKSTILESLNIFFKKQSKIILDKINDKNEMTSIKITALINEEEVVGKISFKSNEDSYKAITTQKDIKEFLLPEEEEMHTNGYDKILKSFEMIYIPTSLEMLPDIFLNTYFSKFIERLITKETRDVLNESLKNLRIESESFLNDFNENSLFIVNENLTKFSQVINLKENIINAKIISDKENSIPINSRGFGYVKTLLLSLMMYFLKKENEIDGLTNKTVFVAIDEIENSISELNLINLIKSMEGFQLLATTHSFRISEILSNRSDILFVILSSTKHEIRTIIDSITINHKINKVFLVEGEMDKKVFNIILENKFKDTKSEIAFYSSNGVKQIPKILDSIDLSIVDKLIIIIDGDTLSKFGSHFIEKIPKDKRFVLSEKCIEFYYRKEFLLEQLNNVPKISGLINDSMSKEELINIVLKEENKYSKIILSRNVKFDDIENELIDEFKDILFS